MVKQTFALYHTATLLTHHHHWSFFLYMLHILILSFVFGTFFFRKTLAFLTDYSPLCISTTRYFSCATKLAISKSPSDYCMTPILEKNFKKRSKDEHQQVKVARAKGYFDFSSITLVPTHFEQTQDMRNLLEHFLAKNPFFTHFQLLLHSVAKS